MQLGELQSQQEGAWKAIALAGPWIFVLPLAALPLWAMGGAAEKVSIGLLWLAGAALLMCVLALIASSQASAELRKAQARNPEPTEGS